MAAAGEISVLTAGAARDGVSACAEAFERAEGIGVAWRTTHGHDIRDRLLAGTEAADIAVLPAEMIAELARAGVALETPRAALGRVPIGAAVRHGAPLPDVATLESLRTAILAAPAIAITTAPSGRHMEGVFARLGLAEAVAGRLVRRETGAAVNAYLASEGADGAIGFGVTSEILSARGRVAYAGPLPEAVQMVVAYEAALLARAAGSEPARAFLASLESAEARRAFAASGLA